MSNGSTQPGIRRYRRGNGFRYVGSNGSLSDEDRERIAELVIPPAWTKVWISDDSRSKIQAVGTDGSGRKQYIYLSAWTEQQEQVKFARSAKFGLVDPHLRQRLRKDAQSDDARLRALAGAVRFLDVSAIRIGGDDYARTNGSFGLTTLRCKHVCIDGETIALNFKGKSGQWWDVSFKDRILAGLFSDAAVRGAQARFLAFREGRRWVPLRAQAVNAYISEISDGEFSAKDFRTWRGTLIAARALSRSRKTPEEKRLIVAIDAVAEVLHNTRAVARGSYIDPLLTERYLDGTLPQQVSTEAGLAAFLDRLHSASMLDAD